MNAKQQDRVRQLVVFIARFADHMADCAHHTSQTSEYCTCGYNDAYNAYQAALNLLDAKDVK